MEVKELSQSQYRQVVATARVAIRALPEIFEESDKLDKLWLSTFRLAYARLLICGLVHLVFDEKSTKDSLLRSLKPKIILDDTVHALPSARWQSEIIFSFSQSVVLEKDLSSIALIFSLTEQLNFMHDLFDADLRSKTLQASADSKVLKTVFETYLFQDIDGNQPTKVFSNFLFSPPPLMENDFRFWNEWFVGFLEGEPINWSIQKKVANLSDEIWGAGPEIVANEIERIQNEFETELAASKLAAPTQHPATAEEKTIVKHKVSTNREALALSVASILEQLEDFRERVRGLNHLEPDFRDDLMNFIDELSNKLDTLLHDIPTQGQTIDDAHASRLVMWLREFKPLVRQKAAKYIAPDNVAEATIPTGIILTCTAVGTLMGPVGTAAGAVVGGLITNQVKPSKAAEQLLKASDTPEETDDTAG